MSDEKKKSYFAGLSKLRQDTSWDGSLGRPLFSGGGFKNFTTGIGTFGRDKMMQGTFWDPVRVSDPECAAMLNGNWLAKRILTLTEFEMFRRGYKIVVPDPAVGKEGNIELAKEIQDACNALNMDDILCHGKIWGNTFGGCLTIIGADDGNDMSEPLDEESIRSIKYLNNIDRRFLFANSYYSDPFAPKFGEVETYQITNSFGAQSNTIIHESRVIRFEGPMVDILKRRQLAGWTYSKLQAVYDNLRRYETDFGAVSNLLVDASQAVFKMNNLMEQYAAQGADVVQQRMAQVDMYRSSIRAVLLDRENEEFERVATQFGGISDVLQMIMADTAGAAEMPQTVLFGRSPAGQNATGDSDWEFFYNGVASKQKKDMEPQILRIIRLLCLAADGPTSGKLPENDITLKWYSLKTPTDSERADIYAKVATADCAYVTSQILLPEEVALSRFRTGEYSLDTEIDVDAREKSLEANLDFSVQSAQEKQELGPAGVREAENPPEPADDTPAKK